VRNVMRARHGWWAWLGALLLFMPLALQADKNQVMGKLHFDVKSKIAKDSGVWVDGQYVGYMKELKGSKCVWLLPGEHRVTVRQDGYQDFTESVQIQPGRTWVVNNVVMQKAPTGPLPPALAELKIAVNPSRAAVFVDGQYVGHVGEFEGIGRGLLVPPGNHQVKIALAGYVTFQTDVQPAARQKVVIKTDLLRTDSPLAPPLVKPGENASAPPPGAGESATAQRAQ
jgi:hypothetical protein